MQKKKDIWFVFNALAVALIILAVMHTIKPYLEPPDPLKPQIMDYAATVQLVRAEDVPKLLVSKNGKPTLLTIYASWCPTCRWKMPQVMDLVQSGKLDHVNRVFLSFDKSAMKLAQYLVHEEYYQDIDPYIYEYPFSDNDLLAALRKAGSAYSGGIPYMELFSPDGHARTFITHTASKDQILTVIGH